MKITKTNNNDVINSFEIVLNSNENKTIDIYGNSITDEDVIVSTCE